MGKIEDKDIELHIDRETLLQEYIPKADYKARLKADMVAMLDEISLEIDEMDYASIIDCQKLIREKINALKEPSNDD